MLDISGFRMSSWQLEKADGNWCVCSRVELYGATACGVIFEDYMVSYSGCRIRRGALQHQATKYWLTLVPICELTGGKVTEMGFPYASLWTTKHWIDKKSGDSKIPLTLVCHDRITRRPMYHQSTKCLTKTDCHTVAKPAFRLEAMSHYSCHSKGRCRLRVGGEAE